MIDGIWGSGKSLLAPIISHLRRVQRVKIDSSYEYLSYLYASGEIELNAAQWLLRAKANESFYHGLLGRESNMRFADDSGLKNLSAMHTLSAVSRLFGPEGDIVLGKPPRQESRLAIMSHMLALNLDLLNITFGASLKLIEVIRHPCFVFNHIRAYLNRYDGCRELTISYSHDGQKIPFFILDWADTYASANPDERTILCIISLYKRLLALYSQVPGSMNVLFVPFERLVYSTNSCLKDIKNFTGLEYCSGLAQVLRTQRLPRKRLNNGLGKSQYGWKEQQIEDSAFIEAIIGEVKSTCASSLYLEMVDMCRLYEQTFQISFGNS